jgi:hypothetical protein
MTDAATKFYNMGKDSATTALAAQTAGADAQKAAAGVLGEIGNQYRGAAGVFGDAGQLYANAAKIFGDAAGIDLDYGKLQLSGYAGLSDAYKAAADYYLGAAGLMSRASGGGGGGGSSTPAQTSEPSEPTGAWVDLTSGHASHADGSQWVWDPNATPE